MAVYSQPGHQENDDDELRLLLQCLRRRYGPDQEIIVAGDFNRRIETMSTFCRGQGLRLAQGNTMAHEIITHHEKRRNGRDAQLDYIAISGQLQWLERSTRVARCWNLSDHNALLSTILLKSKPALGAPSSSAQSRPRGNRVRNEQVKKLDFKQKLRVFRHRDWPRRPWILVCK